MVSDKTTVEGMTSVLAVLHSGSRQIYGIYVSDDGKDRRRTGKLRILEQKAKLKGVPFYWTDADKIQSMTDGNTHGGVCAEVGQRRFSQFDKDALGENGFYVYIDGIEDPFNFGQAVRAVYAAGADGLILPSRNWMSAASTVARSSAGASEYLNAYVGEGVDTVRSFKEKGYKIVCSDHCDDAVGMHEAELDGPLLLVIGGERRGISAGIRALADTVVLIEYGRTFNASLGAAEACAILSFEVLRQRNLKK